VLTRDATVANDLTQSAVLRALEKAEQFQQGTQLDRWVFTITRRIWLNDLRATAVRTAGGLVSVDDVSLPDTGPSTETNIFAREVFKKILDLPEAQRETVLLVYVEGLSYKEASEALEIPIGTIMSRLSAARKKLAQETNEDTRASL
jgi:RNA polymerase sigma-70 factor (ECF subfamily)